MIEAGASGLFSQPRAICSCRHMSVLIPKLKTNPRDDLPRLVAHDANFTKRSLNLCRIILKRSDGQKKTSGAKFNIERIAHLSDHRARSEFPPSRKSCHHYAKRFRCKSPAKTSITRPSIGVRAEHIMLIT